MLRKILTNKAWLYSTLQKAVLTRHCSTETQYKPDLNCAQVRQNAESLDVQLSSHHDLLTYPYLWLRDNCQCSQCYSKPSEGRLFMIKNLDLEIKPTSVNVDGGNLDVTWSDNHSSQYNLNWLKARRFTHEKMKTRHEFHYKPVKTWGKEMNGNIPKVRFEELMESDDHLYKWLVNIEQIGIEIITHAPQRQGVLAEFAERVAYLKRINYGDTFQVKSKFNPSNVSYTGAEIGFHTDLAYYHYAPGVQFLHCISQVESEGGDNVYADGFYAANIMKQEHPEMYNLLKDTLVDFYDVGIEDYKFHQLTRIPVIQEDENGEVCKITYANHSRDSFLSVPIDKVAPLYKAMHTFDITINSDRCQIRYKMRNGDIASFHNYRVLHGRDAYNVSCTGQRHLEGGYLDWDEMRSRRRVLEAEMGLVDD